MDADGDDIRFYQGDTKLDYYIESWDHVTDQAVIWVKAQDVNASGDEINMYYGNSSAIAESSESDTMGKSVWGESSSAKGGLWHLDAGAGNTITDASENGNTGTAVNASWDASDSSWVDSEYNAYGNSVLIDGTADRTFEVSARITIDFTNNMIDFREDPIAGDLSAELTATIAEGTYTLADLATAIKTAMETESTVSGNSITYNVSYDAVSNKFSIASAGGLDELKILWDTGTNAATCPLNQLGFSDTDGTGAVSYTGNGQAVTNLDAASAFTISTWIKTTDTDSTFINRNATGFTIGSTNNKIDFEEDNGIESKTGLTAVIETGTYDNTSLCQEIETALETESSTNGHRIDYSVTYDGVNDKFTIAENGATLTELKLLWSTGTNVDESAGALLGYDTSSDDTGNTTYAGDNAVSAQKVFNLGLTQGPVSYAEFTMDTSDGSTVTLTDNTVQLNDGSEWHQVAVTVDTENAIAKLYVDGELKDEQNFTGNLMPSGKSMLLGSGADIDDTAQNIYTGLVDEVRLVDRVAGAADLLKDYDQTMTQPLATAGEEIILGGLAKNETEIHSGAEASSTVINGSGSDDKVFAYRYAGGETVPSACPTEPLWQGWST